jgi:hypothetical protein
MKAMAMAALAATMRRKPAIIQCRKIIMRGKRAIRRQTAIMRGKKLTRRETIIMRRKAVTRRRELTRRRRAIMVRPRLRTDHLRENEFTARAVGIAPTPAPRLLRASTRLS